MGKLIVIEGTDGSGKSTQFRLLTQRLENENIAFQKIVFPQYSEPSSALIRMYLGGEFGTNPSDVNAYAASSFYAVDRYASYKKAWGQWYEQGGLVVCDRYTTSNAVHQASKEPENKRQEFLKWLYEFEYDRLGLPRPDGVSGRPHGLYGAAAAPPGAGHPHHRGHPRAEQRLSCFLPPHRTRRR